MYELNHFALVFQSEDGDDKDDDDDDDDVSRLQV